MTTRKPRSGVHGIRRLFAMTLIAAATATMGCAAQYALLVGVGRYAALNGRLDLQGPRHDVASMSAMLVRQYAITPENLITLTDEKATRAAVLSSLEALVKRAKPGDQVFFYFSGHGTSAFDEGMRIVAANIGPNSGALAPHDVDVSSARRVVASLIVGDRDVKPILSRLNPEASAWVVLDACYSENSARDIRAWEGEPRGFNIMRLLPPQRADSEPAPKESPELRAKGVAGGEEYPYRNVISFSAASRNQTAADISGEMLRSGRFQTIDGQPHGAFTDALLASLQSSAAQGGLGVITYEQLFGAIRARMEAFWTQRPQALAPSPAAMRQALFRIGSAPVVAHKEPSEPRPVAGGVAVALDNVDDQLRARIAAFPGIILSHGRFDVLVVARQNRLFLYHRTLALIREYALSEVPQLLKRVARQADVEKLLALEFPKQDFPLSLDISATDASGKIKQDYRSEFLQGETVAISVAGGAGTHLLVTDIDSAGAVTVLYPGPGDPELFPDPAARDLKIEKMARTSIEILRAQVRRPLGTEFLKAFAFAEKPAGFDDFRCQAASGGSPQCPTFEADDARYGRFLDLIGRASGLRASAGLKILSRAER
ncbi:MAG TPA: caspase family protein [Bryobacteraceae bacterium]|nr:caspase family protein [Bryobacteraceae bacterium]